MAITTYLYRAPGVRAVDLVPLLAIGAGATVGVPLNDSLTPVTVDSAHKTDLDDAMASLGYEFVSVYTDPSPIVGRRDYGVLAANPVGVVPGAGDYYYNSSLQMEMNYDSLRSKWLSVETASFQVGHNGITPVGNYYRGVSGKTFSASVGYTAPYKGTVVGVTYTRGNVNATAFEVTANGTLAASAASAAAFGHDNTLDGDFSQDDILALRNDAGGASTQDAQVWVRMKWRV